MGDLVYLDARRTPRRRPPELVRPTFFFDLACPLSYLVAERIERTLGDAECVPVAGASLAAQAGSAPSSRPCAVRPSCAPASCDCRSCGPTASRPTSRARCARPRSRVKLAPAPRFALAASRLAFCGGFDLDDPETLAEAAAAAGVPLDACLEAAGDPDLDEPPLLAAAELRARGVETVPAIDVGGRLFGGEAGLLAASSSLRAGSGLKAADRSGRLERWRAPGCGASGTIAAWPVRRWRRHPLADCCHGRSRRPGRTRPSGRAG